MPSKPSQGKMESKKTNNESNSNISKKISKQIQFPYKYSEIVEFLTSQKIPNGDGWDSQKRRNFKNRIPKNYKYEAVSIRSTGAFMALFYKKKIRNELGVIDYVWLEVPKEDKRIELVKEIHENRGHLSRDRLLIEIEKKYFWKGMTNDVKKIIKECVFCSTHKGKTTKQPIRSILPEKLRERCEFDVTHLDKDPKGYKSIATCIDTFSKFLFVLPMKNETSDQIADWLFNISNPPWEIYQSDNGANLNSKVKKNCKKTLCLIYLYKITGNRRSN